MENEKRLIPCGEKCTLDELPCGTIFAFGDDCIAVKSEYRCSNGLIEAFIIDSGEQFWGGVHTAKEQNELMVQPLEIEEVDAVERYEYDAIIEKLENLLCHATGGKFSKAGYSWEDMERMVTDHIEECCEEAIAEEVVHGRWIHIVEDGKGGCYGFCSRCSTEHHADSASALKAFHRYCRWCGAAGFC